MKSFDQTHSNVSHAQEAEAALTQVETVSISAPAYSAPQLRRLGSVKELTFGATGVRHDTRGGRRP